MSDTRTIRSMLERLVMNYTRNPGKEEIDRARAEIVDLIENDIIRVAPPCEEDCSPERHAYHEGGYALVEAQRKLLKEAAK